MFLGGTALYLNAEALTMSQAFRLGSGSALFMTGALLVVLFILMR